MFYFGTSDLGIFQQQITNPISPNIDKWFIKDILLKRKALRCIKPAEPISFYKEDTLRSAKRGKKQQQKDQKANLT